MWHRCMCTHMLNTGLRSQSTLLAVPLALSSLHTETQHLQFANPSAGLRTPVLCVLHMQLAMPQRLRTYTQTSTPALAWVNVMTMN